MGCGSSAVSTSESQQHHPPTHSKKNSDNHTGALKTTKNDPEKRKRKPVDPGSSDQKNDFGWLSLNFKKKTKKILKPHEMFENSKEPSEHVHHDRRDRIRGSLFGLAIGDALGASVEFRPYSYVQEHPVKDFQEGGTWSLRKGQFTDDTTMALCLACSLIVCGEFSLYDQLVRYKWWFLNGYMSSTGECFDIGGATRTAIETFERRQKRLATELNVEINELDHYREYQLGKSINLQCGESDAAGNGSVMRLAPVPLFFHNDPKSAVKFSGLSSRATHGSKVAYDACRFYGALIVGSLNNLTKNDLLNENFITKYKDWFDNEPLDDKIQEIAEGSYKKKQPGKPDGIRGKGYVVFSIEAALWAFYNDENSFEKGVLLAVNLGDDADTTAAIYGQLAGAYYSIGRIPRNWVENVYASEFIRCISDWIAERGSQWYEQQSTRD